MKNNKWLYCTSIILLASIGCKKNATDGGNTAVANYEVQTFFKNDGGITMTGICAIEDANGLDYLLVIDPVTQIVYKINAAGSAQIFLTLPKDNNLSIEPSHIATDGINHFISTFRKGIIKTDFTKTINYLCGFNNAGNAVSGPANTIRFSDPRGLCYSGSAVYMADFGSSLIQQVSRESGFCSVYVGKVGAAPGTVDGDKQTAKFNRPMSICSDGTNGFYVGQETVIRKIFGPSALVSTLAGGPLGYRDGKGTDAAFDLITGICADKEGNVYAVDNLNCCIRKIDKEGNVTTLAGIGKDCGYVDGDAKAAKFNLPRDVCLDSKGNFYVTDAGNNKIRIIKPK